MIRTWHRARDHPARFYCIAENDDGTVDVYLSLSLSSYPTDEGVTEHDATISIVRGVIPWEGMEADIRANFYGWCDAGEVVVM